METRVPKLKYSHSININQSPNCPRCASSNTKFGYYNNYSLSQPRYFCKGCRRYWTIGGSLRNVPIGGTCRKRNRATRASKNHDQYQSVPVKCTNDQSSKNSTDIDLAAVYTKYVSPRINAENVEYSSSTYHPGASTCVSSSLSFDNFLQADSLEIDDAQIQKDQMDLISWSDVEAVLEYPQVFNIYDDINIQDFVYQNSNAF